MEKVFTMDRDIQKRGHELMYKTDTKRSKEIVTTIAIADYIESNREKSNITITILENTKLNGKPNYFKFLSAPILFSVTVYIETTNPFIWVLSI